ncbi:MAG: signal peptidase II [Alphaproteobacteria bacterium]
MVRRSLPWLGLGLAVAVIAADQLSKWGIVAGVFGRSFADGGLFDGGLDPAPVLVTGFLNVVLFGNRGVSFGLFGGAQGQTVLVVVALVIVAALVFWLWRVKLALLAAGIGLIVGGALGNVIDRLRFGAVVDFLDFHAFGLHWPAFNLADSAIVVGVALLLLDGLFGRHSSVE